MQKGKVDGRGHLSFSKKSSVAGGDRNWISLVKTAATRECLCHPLRMFGIPFGNSIPKLWFFSLYRLG